MIAGGVVPDLLSTLVERNTRYAARSHTAKAVDEPGPLSPATSLRFAPTHAAR
jgi:hypothetical protein